MNEIMINNFNGNLTVSSLQVANDFGKQHKHVIETIEKLKAENSALTKMFIESTYVAGTGKSYKCYELTRDGFSLLVMGFTGKKSLEWKLKYIEAFNLMESKLVQKQDSYMIENPAERARRWAEEYEEKLALEQKIEKDKPLVEFAEHIQVSEDCISMNDMAKLASKNGVKIGRNRLFAFLRNQKVLKKDNIPYQKYIEAQRWFQVKESVYDTANFTRICLTTMVTPQGQRGIIKMIKKERLLV